MANFIIGTLFLVALTLFVIAALRVFNLNKADGNNKLSHQPSKTKSTPPFITPAQFKTGYIEDSSQSPADNCREHGSALYPIKQPYVDYGQWKGGDCCSGTCDIIKFNSPP